MFLEARTTVVTSTCRIVFSRDPWLFKLLFVGWVAHVTSCMWRSEDNVGGSVLFFHHMGPGEQVQIAAKRLSTLNHFVSPETTDIFMLLL